MNKLKVEYLVLMNEDGTYCNSIEGFNRLLQVCSDIKISGKKLIYKTNFDVLYSAKTGVVKEGNQRFFQVSFESSNYEKIEVFVELLKTIKKIIHKSGGFPEVLRDDISSYYSYLSYPEIHKIENLMRNLITTFMLRKVGTTWINDSTPKEFKGALDASKRRASGHLNALYSVDFIHLSDFLFKPYSNLDEKDLLGKINKADKIEDLNLEDIKKYVPRSNWFRYFADIVECDDSFLRKNWSDLYDLRCMIAHNAIIGKSEYERVLSLVSKLEEKLQIAIEDIDKVTIPDEDQELVEDSLIANFSIEIANFIIAWRGLEKVVHDLTSSVAANSLLKIKSVKAALDILSKQENFDKNIITGLVELCTVRNRLVHEDYYDDNLELYINNIDEYKKYLLNYHKEVENHSSDNYV